MNKQLILALFGCVLLFAMVQAKPAAPDNEEPVNEMSDNDDDDAELDGGLGQSIRNKLGKSAQSQWGYDVHEKGVMNAYEAKQRNCKGMMKRQTCKTCCNDLGLEFGFDVLPMPKCTCFDSNNHFYNSN